MSGFFRGNPRGWVDMRGSDIELDGRLFRVDVRETLRDNSSRLVRQLAEKGADMVRDRITPKNPTGFTRSMIEVYQQPSDSLFARIRAKSGLDRPPGSALYPSTKRPYIVLAVLESGRYGGKVQYRVRLRANRGYTKKNWVRGAKRQTPLYFFRHAHKVLSRDAKQIRADLIAKGFE